MYEHGNFVRQDAGVAVVWYRRAAEQGDATAQNNLGAMYLTGRGVTQDLDEAVRWFRMAAKQGNLEAQLNLDQLPPQVETQEK